MEAIDRGDWKAAIRIADQAVALDPEDEKTAALISFLRLRAARESSGFEETRRHMTVMFCDMVGSTALASELDPEQMRDVLVSFLGPSAEVIEQHGGHVADFMGDGLLAYFGLNTTREDDAIRAVRASRQILNMIGSLPPVRLGGRLAYLAARIGIHSGPVVVTEMASPKRTRGNFAVGQTPNLASRIQGVAAPNTIVVSAATSVLLGERFDLAPLPATKLKGIATATELFQVAGDGAAADGFVAQRRGAPPVGRASEWSTMEAAWRSTIRSQSKTLGLLGDPGLGKSRLVSDLRSYVGAAGASHRTLQCSEYDLLPLQALVSALEREGVEAGPADQPSERLVQIAERTGSVDPISVAVLATLLNIRPPADLPVAHLTPDEIRERTFEVCLRWLDRLTARGSLLLIVEDVHWADATTLELLTRIVSRAGGAPMLTVLTSRERRPLDVIGAVEVLSLEPLEARDARHLVGDLTRHSLSAETVDLIVGRSDGVPLFLEELSRMLSAPGIPVSGAEPGGIPPTLEQILAARIDRHPQGVELCQLIATVGVPVSLTLLGRLLPEPIPTIRARVEALVTARLLQRMEATAEPVYDFRHSLQRDAVYQLQMSRARRETHASIAAALVEDPSTPPALLAHHHERAGEHAPAAGFWQRAASEYASVASHVEAIGYFRRAEAAIRMASSSPRDDLHLQVQSGLAASLLAAEGYASPEVATAYGRLRALAGREGGNVQRLPSLYGLWAYYYVRGDNRVSSELARRLVSVAADSGNLNDLLAAKAVAGFQHVVVGRFQSGCSLLDEAKAWDAVDERWLVAHHAGIGAHVNLAVALWILGQFRDARQALTMAVDRAEKLDLGSADFTRAYTYCWAAEMCWHGGDHAAAVQYANRAVTISAEHGFSTWMGSAMLHLAAASGMIDDPEEQIPRLRLLLDAWREAGAEAGLPGIFLALAQVQSRSGRAAEALASVEEGLSHVSVTQELQWRSPLRRWRGELIHLTHRDQRARAEAEILAAAEIARRQGAVTYELIALTSLLRLRGKPTPTDESVRLSRLLDSIGSDAEDPQVLAAREVLRSVPTPESGHP
jgi:class 3 adenylate cyclase/tetratricopeptide (TPR) repeat protein